jgi:hypothetical protein
MVIRTGWIIQALLMGAAIVGAFGLVRAGRATTACLLAAPILYITAVHFPLLKEARQSLPAKPVVLLLAVTGIVYLRGQSLTLETQVHERQHLG